jgi:hypothetical protein
MSIPEHRTMPIRLSKPPVPDADWLHMFAQYLLTLQPGLSPVGADEHAQLAHPFTWLLEPAEAAELWEALIRQYVSERLL